MTPPTAHQFQLAHTRRPHAEIKRAAGLNSPHVVKLNRSMAPIQYPAGAADEYRICGMYLLCGLINQF
jgi:hypothetical protein